MSKMDNLRAMREARYEQRTAASGRPAPKAARPPAPRPKAEPEVREPQVAEPDPAGATLCGHRSMNGRTCTREQGHAAKSHRYS
jgi:hypothetical protein